MASDKAARISRIVGIVLVRNEDIFVERAVRNIIEFCDHIIVADNYSKDKTWDIVTRLADQESKIECHRIRRTSDSHDLIKDYAGTDTWVFGVDGDEIYDPKRLKAFREQILDGTYDDWWVIFGNVLNCASLELDKGEATGYLAPPCRSITKLYNFAAIDAWEGACRERLHGGNIRFHSGYDASLRRNLLEEVEWDNSDFRCLHTCFLQRSSLEAGDGGFRLNIMDRAAVPRWRRKLGLNKQYVPWKLRKYKRGELTRVDSTVFFSRTKGL